MSKIIDVKDGKSADYNIYITNGFQELYGLLKPFLSADIKAAIITDSNVEPLYLKDITAVLKDLGIVFKTHTFKAGEENKNLETVKDVYSFLIKEKFERRDVLIALGGGVVGDLTGFVAATYLRGVSFIQIPTTLLSQTDSSIGGKTGVDFDSYKNMVGAFHQPKLCYMNTDTLKTLDNTQFLSGFGEIVKAALIKNKDFFDWIILNTKNITNKEPNTINEMIYRACLIKRSVVQNDPNEAGERALLNFGHTLGHAIERCAKFSVTHGECVVLGMIAALFISLKRNMISKSNYEKILSFLRDFGYKMTISGLNKDEIINTAKSDKKMEAGVLKFILLNGIGNAVIVKDVIEDDLRDALDIVLE